MGPVLSAETKTGMFATLQTPQLLLKSNGIATEQSHSSSDKEARVSCTSLVPGIRFQALLFTAVVYPFSAVQQ